MARNGAGIYVLPTGQPVVTGTTISSTTFNTLTTDLANALTTSIASDGQTAMSVNLPMGGNKLTGLGAATVAGDAVRFEQVGAIALTQGVAASGVNSDITSLAILSGYLFGCTLSTAGASATMSVAAGKAQDSTGVQLMTVSAIAKTTAAWAVGTAAGGLDTGTIANGTWYHFYTIRRPDTGVVDVLCSLSATAPTLPANYTQFRRIGAGKTNGSAQWLGFSQNGDEFLWNASVMDINTGVQSTIGLVYTMSVPVGVRVNALVAGWVFNTATTNIAIYSPDVPPQSPSGNGPICNANSYGSVYSSVRTNTASQIAIVASLASTSLNISTLGWIDTRGRNA